MRRLLIVVFLFVTGFAFAQTGAETLPLIQLSSFSVESGEDLTLNASDLDPGTEYELSLTSPTGNESTETVQADEAGNLDYTVQLDEVGRWQLTLDKLQFNVAIDVQESLAVTPDESATEDAAEPPTELPTESSEAEEQSPAESEEAGDASALQEGTDEAFEPLTEPDETGEADREGTEDAATDAPEAPVVVPAPDAEAAPDNAVPNTTSPSRFSPLESLAVALGRSGWYGVMSLLLAIVALHVVLMAKYWPAQSVNLERRRILGRSVAPWSRALAMRYYDLTEKIVVLLLFVAVMVMAALAAWSAPGVHAETWNVAVARVFQNPWTGLLNLRPAAIGNILWTLIVALFLLAVLITVVWLFIPRLRWVGNAPRSAIYHVLAILVPGSGLADEMWGLLLIIPWALFGLDALIDIMGWGFGLGLSLFWDLIIVGVIYLINLVAVIVEYLSYNRRMTALKRDNPELAQEFGLLRSVQ